MGVARLQGVELSQFRGSGRYYGESVTLRSSGTVTIPLDPEAPAPRTPRAGLCPSPVPNSTPGLSGPQCLGEAPCGQVTEGLDPWRHSDQPVQDTALRVIPGPPPRCPPGSPASPLGPLLPFPLGLLAPWGSWIARRGWTVQSSALTTRAPQPQPGLGEQPAALPWAPRAAQTSLGLICEARPLARELYVPALGKPQAVGTRLTSIWPPRRFPQAGGLRR